MTREEAIEYITGVREFYRTMEKFADTKDEAKFGEALDMAIEALSTPSDDLISRQWLLDVYGDYIGDNGEPKYHVPLEVVRQNIKDAPSAELVRCKDCRWYEPKYKDKEYDCPQGLYAVYENDFCSHGERREP